MRKFFQKTWVMHALLVMLLLGSNEAYGQIVINEFLASNSSVIEDPDFQSYSDWLELYNAGSVSVNLKGYYITDNLSNPVKWKIPVDAVIAPGGFIIIWTDGRDTLLHTSYKLAQIGEEIGIFSPAGMLVDTLHYLSQNTDISVGRYPDGSSQWYYFDQPTPGTQNNTTPYPDIVNSTPEFSVLGGLYDSPVNVELSGYMGGTIRYTLDGSDPKATDPVFANPISITKTTVVRARIFKPGLIPGPTVTHSYFLNEHFQTGNLPVVSIATDPENFWDPSIGIYVQDFKPEWEVPVNVELFENNGSDRAAFNERAGTKINGLNAWQLPEKMLGIYFRKRYGSGSLDYQLIFDKDRKSFQTFALRASGSDWSYTLFRDGMVQNATALNMSIDRMGFRPCVVYVNGQYMGIHNIREKVDEDFIAQNHQLEGGTFDMVENEDYAETGDLTAYNEFLQLHKKDLSVQANYNAVAEAMDIENFTDLVCTEVYSRNNSINHNIMAWKPKGTGKWKWILTDLDRGFFNPSTNLISFYTGQEVFPFKELMHNQGYVAYFGKRLADHLYTTFNPIRIKKLIDKHQQLIESEMPDHIARWLGTTSSYGSAMPSLNYWYTEVGNLKTFADARPLILLNDLKSYGFSGSSQLNLMVSPSNAGTLTFNGLKITEPEWSGYYLNDVEIELVAKDNPGYNFKGWALASQTRKTIIAKNAVWKYFDGGLDLGTAWHDAAYNDAAWSEGPAELGYGDGDENTVVSYGGNSSNKYITTYFRQAFNITDQDPAGKNYQINLLCDDGAVIYINGQEALRVNISYGIIDYQSLASTAVGSPLESQFVSYPVDASFFKTGGNVIAVEVHQSGATSSDISFNLELVSGETIATDIISTENSYRFTLTGDMSLTAMYESDGKCILPPVISQDMSLGKECSPYLAQGDITILSGVNLTVEPGVQIWMPPDANMLVNGKITANGTADERITVRLNPDYNDDSWGAIVFINAPDTSRLSYVTIEDASRGPVPVRDVAAISAFKANLVLDNLVMEDVDDNPIAGRYSDITLTNSSLHSKVTGDLINVKYGKGRIENCTFRGNDQFDSDGIDYDDVENGIIRNSRIHGFYGFNSDAIDIGEKARNIMIDSMLIYDIADKGVSVGQQSTAHVSHSTFVDCNLGFGLKDSCHVTIDHCTFYSNNFAVSCYEKNPGSAGGNVIVTNSILSDSYEKSCFADNLSSILISNSLSDTDTLPENSSNKFGNPLFTNPNSFNFRLLPGSPCLEAASDNNGYSDMGTYYHAFSAEPHVMLNRIFYNPLNNADKSEYLAILNPSDVQVDLSGYKITKGVIFEFPQGAMLYPGEQYFIVKDLYSTSWQYAAGKKIQWTEGSLSNQGEKIQLTDNYGIVIDQVEYKPQLPWPSTSYLGEVLMLKSTELDNHFAESWTTSPYTDINENEMALPDGSLAIYPNPSSGYIHISAPGYPLSFVEIYDISGREIEKISLNGDRNAELDISHLENGTYLVRYGNAVQKIILMK
jgi:hypothetical protein